MIFPQTNLMAKFSRPAALLAATTIAVGGIVVFVHYKQNADRERMHKGVIRDKERLAIKMREGKDSV